MEMETGQKIVRLTLASTQRKSGKLYWVCRCDCGNEKSIRSDALKSGATVSCGCYSADATANRNRKHGESDSSCYQAWRGMLNRCLRPDHDAFKYYGGRGICVCDRWRDDYLAFKADMGTPPPRHQLDRIDSDKGYEPGNCRWVTAKVNANNRRNTRKIVIGGVEKTIEQASIDSGVLMSTISTRLFRGMDPETAIQAKDFRKMA